MRASYIDGEFIETTSNELFSVMNPGTETKLFDLPLASEADVNRAVASAKRAFESFSSTDREYRLQLLKAIISQMKLHAKDLAQAIHEEMGAPMDLATSLQVRRWDTLCIVLISSHLCCQVPMGILNLESFVEALSGFSFEV